MKKWVCLLLAVLMVLGCAACAGAEPEWIEIGKGRNSVLVLVKVMEQYVYGYELRSNEDQLLNALENFGLVQGEKTAQGYVIDKVDGFKGRPEENGAFWTLQTYNDKLERFQMAGEDLSDMGTEEYTAIAFVRNTEAIPYEEKIIFMAVEDGDNVQAFEILTEDQDTVLECLLDNGLISVREEEWGYTVIEAAGIRADYDEDGSYFNICEYNEDTESFEYMDRSLASITIDELPSFPATAGYAFIRSE